MRLLALGAMALTLGLGGCMHAMGGTHHEGMMGAGMMGQHDAADCPGADDAQHGAGAQAPGGAEHEHQAGSAECPRAEQEGQQQHEHDQQAQPN